MGDCLTGVVWMVGASRGYVRILGWICGCMGVAGNLDGCLKSFMKCCAGN